MFIVTIVLAVLLALVFAAAGVPKITGAKSALENADHLKVGHGLWKVIGVLEVLAAIGLIAGLWVWPLGVAAGIGLVLLMAGAVMYHVRNGDSAQKFSPPIVLALIALAEVIVRVASA